MGCRSRITRCSTSQPLRGPVATGFSCASRRLIRPSILLRRGASWKSSPRARCAMSWSKAHRLFCSGSAAFIGLALLGIGCTQQMAVQPSYRPYRPTDFFADGTTARPLPADTVARGHLRDDTLLFTGKDSSGQDATEQECPVLYGGRKDAPRRRQVVVGQTTDDDHEPLGPHADVDQD